MNPERTRREFLLRLGSTAAGVAMGRPLLAAAEHAIDSPTARVVIGRDDALTRGRMSEHQALVRRLLDASMQKLTRTDTAAAAWGQLFRPKDRVGIKVKLNLCLTPVRKYGSC